MSSDLSYLAGGLDDFSPCHDTHALFPQSLHLVAAVESSTSGYLQVEVSRLCRRLIGDVTLGIVGPIINAIINDSLFRVNYDIGIGSLPGLSNFSP